MDLFDDVRRTLDEFTRLANEFDAQAIKDKARWNARTIAENVAKNRVLNALDIALREVDEIGMHSALRNRIKRNLSDPRHYRAGYGLDSMVIVDPQLAGDFQDLMQGARAVAMKTGAKGGTQHERLYGWKWGIYKPSREGIELAEAFRDYPTYDEIVSLRLREWGNKAPYWYILDKGNAGGAEAYPSYQGTGFVTKVRGQAQSILADAWDTALRDILRDIETGLTRYLERVEIGRTTGGKMVQVQPQRVKSGEIVYQVVIGGQFGRGISPGEDIYVEGEYVGTFRGLKI